MNNYSLFEPVPLSFSRVGVTGSVSGLTVTATVVNAVTGATLLSATTLPEIGTTGVYNFSWVHSLKEQTECAVTYTVGSKTYREFILIGGNAGGSII
jgi:hypothetical protein